MVERELEAGDILDEVIKDIRCLLNRVPTPAPLEIEAFEPVRLIQVKRSEFDRWSAGLSTLTSTATRWRSTCPSSSRLSWMPRADDVDEEHSLVGERQARSSSRPKNQRPGSLYDSRALVDDEGMEVFSNSPSDGSLRSRRGRPCSTWSPFRSTITAVVLRRWKRLICSIIPSMYPGPGRRAKTDRRAEGAGRN